MNQPVRRVLVLNVGKPTDGNVADRPEAYALREARPDFVAFVCSHAADFQAGSLRFVDDYAALTGLPPERYEVVSLEDPDDLVACYQRLVECFADLRRRFPDAEFLADYTAGTKSMSAALVLAALDSEGSARGAAPPRPRRARTPGDRDPGDRELRPRQRRP
jgi:CRISPR-associated protein (TIGR02710 family)